MRRSRTVLRISFGLVVLTISILLALDLIGILPRPDRSAEIETRLVLCESIAAQTSAAVERNEFAKARVILEMAVERNQAVLSAGLRGPGGRLLLSTRDHATLWSPAHETRSDAANVRVPIQRGGRPAGTVEIHLSDLDGPTGLLARSWERPLVRLVVVVGLVGFVVYGFYIRRTLRHLDPSAVIPTRVQAALDVMTEGVLLVDDQEQIVLANQAIAARMGVSARSLLGMKPSSFEWLVTESRRSSRLPWQIALQDAVPSGAVRLNVVPRRGPSHSFIVNAAPVLDGDGRAKGAIATFDDVTELEHKSRELEEAMVELEKSRDEVRLQNEELQTLARTDPLTGIANRRAFLEMAAGYFQESVAGGSSLACLMVDIDHFKEVNDSYGHSSGDRIIQQVAEAAVSLVRSREKVCRYGGEEFCILLTDCDSKRAAAVGERLRASVDEEGFAAHPVSISVGVASLSGSHAGDVGELINQADEALYAAKAAGRNQVVRFEAVHAWR